MHSLCIISYAVLSITGLVGGSGAIYAHVNSATYSGLSGGLLAATSCHPLAVGITLDAVILAWRF